MLPKLPLVSKAADFWNFSNAGQELAKLHLEYENIPPYPEVEVTGTEAENYYVNQMRFPTKGQKHTNMK